MQTPVNLFWHSRQFTHYDTSNKLKRHVSPATLHAGNLVCIITKHGESTKEDHPPPHPPPTGNKVVLKEEIEAKQLSQFRNPLALSLFQPRKKCLTFAFLFHTYLYYVMASLLSLKQRSEESCVKSYAKKQVSIDLWLKCLTPVRHLVLYIPYYRQSPCFNWRSIQVHFREEKAIYLFKIHV